MACFLKIRIWGATKNAIPIDVSDVRKIAQTQSSQMQLPSVWDISSELSELGVVPIVY